MAGIRLFLALLLLPLYAQAEDSCYRDFLVVDHTISWDFSQEQNADFSLPSWNGSNPPFYTPAAAHFSLSNNQLNALFDFKTDLLSLPYNVYRVDILVGDNGDPEQFASTRDFTSECKQPGYSFYPGARLALVPEKIPPRSNGAARGIEPVRIRIWGTLR